MFTNMTHVQDNHDETQIDAPETPAHLFAVRAFKQALFGTPKPVEKPAAKPAKSTINRPDHRHSTVPSPSKPAGILLTPGTGGARRKTVSFGSYMHNNGDAVTSSVSAKATPKLATGGFPVPEATEDRCNVDKSRASPVQRTLFSKNDDPAAARGFENVKAGATRRQGEKLAQVASSAEAAKSDQLQTESEKYWKQEYEKFSSKSKLEMRRLMKKGQVAKQYAKDKDVEASALRDSLKQEQRKVSRLEEDVRNYISQLEEAVHGANRGASHRRENRESKSAQENQTLVTLRSDLQTTENALLKAEGRIRSLCTSNTELEQSLEVLRQRQKDSEMEARKLREENRSLRLKLEAGALSRPTNAKQDLASSDIWADLAIEDPEVRYPRSGTVSGRSTSRAPLSQRPANVEGLQAPALESQKGHRISRSTNRSEVQTSPERQQRMEAARKRLELKKSLKSKKAASAQ